MTRPPDGSSLIGGINT